MKTTYSEAILHGVEVMPPPAAIYARRIMLRRMLNTISRLNRRGKTNTRTHTTTHDKH